MLELPGGLGRLVNHDPRSRAFPVSLPTVPTRTKMHRHYGPVLDQGQLGSCTGNAAAQAMNTAPFHRVGKQLTENDAVSIYSRATAIDPFDGTYPPEDTGSDGTSVAKVLRERGLITEFRHIFGHAAEAVAVIQLTPFLIGVDFYEGMVNGDDMEPHGNLLGGHEMLVTGWDSRRKAFRILNSWGSGWGQNGFGWMKFDSLDFLLHQQGDATVLVR